MRFNFRFLWCLCLLFLAQTQAFSQDDTWIRVASDNGEFSVEVPAKYGFYANKDGFTVSNSQPFSSDYVLREMNMFNAYHEKTLISFESYRAEKSALEALREKEMIGGKVSEIKSGSVKLKQVVLQTPDSYAVKRYFSSKNYIYVLTAASRTGETDAMKRFFDSLLFNADGTALDPGATKPLTFSQLKVTPIETDSQTNKPAPANPNSPKTPADTKDSSKLVIISKPRASYTEAARKSLEKGIVRLRVTFSKDGRISNVTPVQTLQAGLLRESVLAAIRIKFLPQEKDGEPVTVTRVVEYNFDIY